MDRATSTSCWSMTQRRREPRTGNVMRRADALAASFDLCKYHIPSSRQSLSTQSICRDCAMPRRPAYTRLATAEEW